MKCDLLECGIDLSGYEKQYRVIEKKNNESQAVFAEQLGVSKRVLSEYERGIVIPSVEEALRIAYALGVPVDYVFTLEKHELPILSQTRASGTAGTKHNWDSFRFIDLFAGIGGIRLGFEGVGGRCVFSSKFDEGL